VALSKKRVVPFLILLIGIAVFTGLRATRPQTQVTQAQERIWRVQVQQAHPQTRSPTLTLYGLVETPRLLNAAAPNSAVVKQVLVKEGEFVERGQFLIELDERDFRPRLQRSAAEVAELEAEIQSESNRHRSNLQSLKHEMELLSIAKAEVQRAQRLKTQKLGSDTALDAARQTAARQALAVTSRQFEIADHEARLQRLQSRLKRARASLVESTLDYERSRLLAPFDGVISAVEVAPGDRVRESDVLLKMYALDSLEVRARLPSTFQEELQDALREGAPPTGTARLGGRSIRLRLDRISGEADPGGVDGLFRVIEGGDSLRLGQVAKFRLQRPAKENAVAVPYQALYGGNRIYVLENGRLRGMEIEPLGQYLGRSAEEWLLIRSASLHKGDRVVMTHLPNAVDGLRAEAVQ
jgi:HlyD family secretion protein